MKNEFNENKEKLKRMLNESKKTKIGSQNDDYMHEKRKADRQTDRRRDRNRQTDLQTDKQTEINIRIIMKKKNIDREIDKSSK